MSRSVASGRRARITSSTASRSAGSRSASTVSMPALTMPMSSPASIACRRKTACMASRTWLLPRNENDTFEMPPLVSAPGRCCLIQRTASMKSTA